MSFKVDGYIQDWLRYLDSGDEDYLGRSISDLKNDDSVTGQGFIQFAEALSMLVNVIDMPILCQRINRLLGTKAGEMITSFIHNEPSYFSAPNAATAGLFISHSEKTVSAWALILHLNAERFYGVVSTFRPLHPLVRALTLDYLDQNAAHTSRKMLFQKTGVSALTPDTFYRQVACAVPSCVTVNDGSFHDAVLASRMGFEGLVEANAQISTYLGNITPTVISNRFKKPVHFRRALQIYAELLVADDDRSPWTPFVRIVNRGEYARSESVMNALRQFFFRGYEAQGKSFETWATTLNEFVGKPDIVDGLWSKPGFLEKLEALDSSLIVSLFHGSKMKREMLKRYPKHIDASFSRDLGL